MITQIEHMCISTANFHWSKTKLLMYSQWYIRLVIAISRKWWTIWSS